MQFINSIIIYVIMSTCEIQDNYDKKYNFHVYIILKQVITLGLVYIVLDNNKRHRAKRDSIVRPAYS